MSGAAGLAAAKRRRGGAANSPGGPESRPSLAKPPATPQQAQPRFDILSIVTDHETRLRLIEAGGGDPSVETRTVNNSVTSSQGEVEELRRQVEDLRTLLSKVQTFAMETNTKLLRLQISRMSLEEPVDTVESASEPSAPKLVVSEKEEEKGQEDKPKGKKANAKKIEE